MRAEARKHRSRNSFAEERPEGAAELFWQTFPDLPKSLVIAGYWPKGREFDSMLILEQAHEKGYKTALPVIDENSLILRFLEWNTTTEMVSGAFDIAQPSGTNDVSPDIILVPLLAFDRRGARLGQGGGYYDATLEKLRKEGDVIAVGTAYAGQAVLFNLPTEAHDERMDMVITPKQVHDFRRQL
ncbi:MAG: 5-formyltetrahydrofolate cyclo-ligase [Micavibrio sp.]|nr:5-formyltetrahydrofolate cyclo-ligase [Micavibrio sp.]